MSENSTPEHAADEIPDVDPVSTETSVVVQRPRLSLAVVGVLVATFVVAGCIGAGITYASLRPVVDAAQAHVNDLTSRVKSAEATAAKAQSDEADLRKIWADKETELKARDASLTTREMAVKATETKIAQNSFGPGVVIVGRDVAAGEYATSGVTNCYYVWKSDTTKSATIIDNNIVNGSATITLNDGDVFESNRCGRWTKVS